MLCALQPGSYWEVLDRELAVLDRPSGEWPPDKSKSELINVCPPPSLRNQALETILAQHPSLQSLSLLTTAIQSEGLQETAPTSKGKAAMLRTLRSLQWVLAQPQQPTWSVSVSSAAPPCPWSAICPVGTATACGVTCPLAISPVTCRATTCPWETGPGETCPLERHPVAMHPAATSHKTSPVGTCRGQAGKGRWVAEALLHSCPICSAVEQAEMHVGAGTSRTCTGGWRVGRACTGRCGGTLMDGTQTLAPLEAFKGA